MIKIVEETSMAIRDGFLHGVIKPLHGVSIHDIFPYCKYQESETCRSEDTDVVNHLWVIGVHSNNNDNFAR